MKLSLILAVAENKVIGNDNKLAWHLPADLKYFKNLTNGHHIIMGRKTYESIGKPLPNRTTVIITRNTAYKANGCIVVNSLQAAIAAAKNDEEAFIIGGAEIFQQALPVADVVYLTQIHASFEGDTFFESLNLNEWQLTSKQRFEPDEKNKYSYSFCTYTRINYLL